jgi:hypothetical protein
MDWVIEHYPPCNPTHVIGVSEAAIAECR